jgi:hypothetical protein
MALPHAVFVVLHEKSVTHPPARHNDAIIVATHNVKWESNAFLSTHSVCKCRCRQVELENAMLLGQD